MPSAEVWKISRNVSLETNEISTGFFSDMSDIWNPEDTWQLSSSTKDGAAFLPDSIEIEPVGQGRPVDLVLSSGRKSPDQKLSNMTKIIFRSDESERFILY